MNNEGFSELPEKYRYLNEDGLERARIYVNGLIGEDDDYLLHNMNDFRYVFENSGLVYGKNRRGYYVLCVDNDDVNRLYETL